MFAAEDPRLPVMVRSGHNACLVQTPAFTPTLWRDMPDPFPARGPITA